MVIAVRYWCTPPRAGNKETNGANNIDQIAVTGPYSVRPLFPPVDSDMKGSCNDADLARLRSLPFFSESIHTSFAPSGRVF